MEFSEKLKALRAERGISQAQLASEIHISRSAVAKWENGLGLPGEESLQLLAAYFKTEPAALLPDKSSEETLVSKNRTIVRQKRLILGLLAGAGVALFLLAAVFLEPFRKVMDLVGLGVMLVILGLFNMQGNIASIHWYHRRKVTPENQKAYGRLMGLGTLLCGVGMTASGALQMLLFAEAGALLLSSGILAGFSLMLYAQLKYNRGLF